MAPRYLDRLRALCLALPATYEKIAWGEPTFRIVKGKIFAMHASPGNHHGGGRPSVWLHASKENQLLMIADQPSRFFPPPYVGPSGWIGVWLDGDVPWDELRELIRDAWLRVAPKKAVAMLHDGDHAPATPASTAKKRPAAKSKRTAKHTPTPKPKLAAKKKLVAKERLAASKQLVAKKQSVAKPKAASRPRAR